tara:strand:- start:379 stop:759 length:381 start_codon:yes stop_codon:yes gene_type:complete
MKIHIPTQRSVSPIITFNKRSSKSVYDWIDRNKLDYTLFNNIIRDNRLSTQEFIEMYNNRSSNEKLPENVFKHFIKIINTNQNTYWGVGPFIKRGERWKIMMRDDIRFLNTNKQQVILFDACTQTD